MPATVNGIGTQYYGKKNPRSYQGVCESCGRVGTLTDYETGYYIVVLFIPLIPLGRKQILADCSSCRRHRVMKLSEWVRMREESVDAGMDRLADDPTDLQAALDLLGTMTYFNQMDDARDLAAATAKSHDEDVDAQLALGGWHEQQNSHTQADACYKRAIELDPDYPPCLRVQAVDLLQDGKPAEAAKKLEALRSPSEHFETGLFVMLARGYHDAGMHEASLQEFKSLMEMDPEIGKDKQVRKMVKASEKALGNPESILPKKGLFG